MTLFACKCPHCSSENVRFDYGYNTLCGGYRQMRLCLSRGSSFLETIGTFLEGLRTPVSLIWQVLKARTEGMTLNTCRVFNIAKAQCIEDAPHLEEKQIYMLNQKIIFNAF